MQTIDERLKSNFYNSENVKSELKKQLDLLKLGKTSPFSAADFLLGIIN